MWQSGFKECVNMVVIGFQYGFTKVSSGFGRVPMWFQYGFKKAYKQRWGFNRAFIWFSQCFTTFSIRFHTVIVRFYKN